MKRIIWRFRQIIENTSGAVQIIESAFVFPVMFIILFFLVYMGNAHYVKSQVEAAVSEAAIRGAGYCADPLLQTIKETGSIPGVDDISIQPYRYLFGGMDEIESLISRQVKNTISSTAVTLFKGMEPRLKTSESDIAHYNNHILYSTFSVEVNCAIEFPIRFLGKHTPEILSIKTRAEVAVNDTSEFIRNTDLVIDYFEDSKLGQSIKGVFKKINDFISKFAEK